MTMLTRQKQKAIIEGMLFVSSEPVTLPQIMKRLRQIIKKQSMEQDVSESEVESVDGVTGNADLQSTEVSNDLPVIDEINSSSTDEVENSDETDADSMIVEDESSVLQQLMSKKAELDHDINREEIKQLLQEIQEEHATEDHGVELVCVAKGYQFRTKYDISCYLKDEQPDAPTRLSPSSLETLAIVAYQQPVTKLKIEEVRGVDSGGVIKTLLDKEFVRIVGRSEEPGKPLIYGTTNRFLEVFGLNTLRDLPSLKDFNEMSLAEKRNKVGDTQNEDDLSETQSILPEDEPMIHIDEAEMAAVSEAEQAILDELDDSMKNLKDVEKKYAPEKPEINVSSAS